MRVSYVFLLNAQATVQMLTQNTLHLLQPEPSPGSSVHHEVWVPRLGPEPSWPGSTEH
jgi:hypothetical protein